MTNGFSEYACPTCHAAFRGQMLCTRCGTDLEPLLRVLAKAYQLRSAACLALERGDAVEAFRFAKQAVRLQRTEAGRKIMERAYKLICSPRARSEENTGTGNEVD